MPHDLSLNPHAAASLTHIGTEREPMLRIDALLGDPHALIGYAASETAFAPAYGPDGGYPGIRAPAPLDYIEAVVRAVDPLLRDAFGLGAGTRLGRAECNFSLVTLSPEALAPAQRVPHVDTTNGLQFAFLHYLCGPEQGGTGFYRHRATGYETLTPDRLPHYEAIRAAETDGQGYIAGDTVHFAQTEAIDAALNRLVVYRSRVLHSGRIPADARLSADPREGRLTANIFLTYRAG